MTKAVITNIIATLFIFLFVYAAANKIIDYQQFKIQLAQSPLLTSFAATVAWIVPSIEIIIATGLSIARFRSCSFYASFFLMLLFTLYIIAITQFSDYIPCSCGGVLEHMSWNQHLAFNVIFVFLAIVGIYLDPNQHQVIARTKTTAQRNRNYMRTRQ